MIWYIIGALIGFFYLKKKYNLKFWAAIWNGIMLILGIYFAFGAVSGIFTIIMGLEEVSPTIYYVLFYAFLAYGGLSYIKRLNANNSTASEVPKNTYMSDDTYSGSVNGYQPEPGDTIETKLAGVTFEGRQNILRHMIPGQKVIVEREPSNRYDSNAIKVINPDEDNIVIGYISRELAAKIAWIIDEYQTKTITGNVSAVYRIKNDPSILGVRISFELPDDVDIQNQLEENELDFIDKDIEFDDSFFHEDEENYYSGIDTEFEQLIDEDLDI